MQRSIILFYLFCISAALTLTRCANPVSPQGGPKDADPPEVVSCDPPNLTTKFKASSFRIEFNEFISLKNPVNEIFISPPQKSQLDTRLKGRSLVVKMEDSLAPNTTYAVTFGKAIIDLTEGNVLMGFSYVFSTGDYVDTLSLQGTLTTAFDHKPQKDVFIELYIDNNDTLAFDSLPVKVVPYYITKTDEQGNFMFHNLQNGKFKLFALADQNDDLIFNQLTEKIAFYDSLALPYYIPVPKADTTRRDSSETAVEKLVPSLAKKTDSLHKIDSVHKADSIREYLRRYPSYSLFLFEETDSIQRIQKVANPMEGMVLLVFRYPVAGLRVVPLNFDSIAPWHLEEPSKNRDSVRLWITRPEADSLTAKIILGNEILDTISIEVSKRNLQVKSSKKEKPTRLGIVNSASGSGLNQHKNKLVLTFSSPLTRWDFKRVLLFTDKDTITPRVEFYDSVKRKIIINYPWEEEKSYKILVPDSVFFGFRDITHDTIRMEFKTKGERDLGNLIVSMNMENRPGQYIVQLLNDKESIVFEEHVITGSEKVHFNYMPPGKYKLKAINDRNMNRRWDTGNYRLNIQPEEVIYFAKPVDIRANWDVEESWD